MSFFDKFNSGIVNNREGSWPLRKHVARLARAYFFVFNDILINLYPPITLGIKRDKIPLLPFYVKIKANLCFQVFSH